MDLKQYIKELLSLINTSELSPQQINRMKDLICFLSEKRKNGEIDSKLLEQTEYILYSASLKMRTFGYNRLNDFKIENMESDEMSKLREHCVESYYTSRTNFVLDKKQKEVLDDFENHNQRLFLSAPTSFGKTFLLKEIIYRHYNIFKNIVIVLPTVALLIEVTDDLSKFCKEFKLPYSIINSIYRDLDIGEENIFILTPERVLRLFALHSDLKIDFFFYDEIYKIDEDVAIKDDDDINSEIESKMQGRKKEKKHSAKNNRAIAFRLALYFLLKKANALYIAGPFIKMDALKSGFTNMLERYSIFKKEISFEPTLKNKYEYHNSKIILKSPFEAKEISTGVSSKKDKINRIIEYLNVGPENQAIVYCLYPRNTEKDAMEVCEPMKNIIKTSYEVSLFIDHIKSNYNFAYGPKGESSLNHWSFLYALEHNVGIHNGKFPKYFQREIMNLYNSNFLPILFCTSTIVEGVNTNAKTIILYNNPSGETEEGKKFLLLNINGRAGRYQHHFMGNIVYLDKGSIEIESGNSIQLDFKLFSDDALLDEIDLENSDEEDISLENQLRKRNICLDTDLLPDEVFEQNRLIERKKQEEVLRLICDSKYYNLLIGIEIASINSFINNYFETILSIWAEAGEIRESQVFAIKSFCKNYAQNGYYGVLKYKFDNYFKYWKNKNETEETFVNSVYNDTFKDVKDTVEYQIPRIISLFETLINRAFEIKGHALTSPLDLSAITRYFELGAKTKIGVDMVEKGVPTITIRKIESVEISGDNIEEQKEFITKNISKFSKMLDNYEKEMLRKYGISFTV